MAIIIHAPKVKSLKDGVHSVTADTMRLAQISAELHYGGADGKQPHKNGSSQDVHGQKGGRKPSFDDGSQRQNSVDDVFGDLSPAQSSKKRTAPAWAGFGNDRKVATGKA